MMQKKSRSPPQGTCPYYKTNLTNRHEKIYVRCKYINYKLTCKNFCKHFSVFYQFLQFIKNKLIKFNN